MQKINVKALGLSLGIVWAFCVLFCGLSSLLFDFGTSFVVLFSSFYYGYAATFLGSIIGAVWGFVDAFIGGVLIAWLYNKLAKV